jgi:hypothetical protein
MLLLHTNLVASPFYHHTHTTFPGNQKDDIHKFAMLTAFMDTFAIDAPGNEARAVMPRGRGSSPSSDGDWVDVCEEEEDPTQREVMDVDKAAGQPPHIEEVVRQSDDEIGQEVGIDQEPDHRPQQQASDVPECEVSIATNQVRFPQPEEGSSVLCMKEEPISMPAAAAAAEEEEEDLIAPAAEEAESPAFHLSESSRSDVFHPSFVERLPPKISAPHKCPEMSEDGVDPQPPHLSPPPSQEDALMDHPVTPTGRQPTPSAGAAAAMTPTRGSTRLGGGPLSAPRQEDLQPRKRQMVFPWAVLVLLGLIAAVMGCVVNHASIAASHSSPISSALNIVKDVRFASAGFLPYDSLISDDDEGCVSSEGDGVEAAPTPLPSLHFVSLLFDQPDTTAALATPPRAATWGHEIVPYTSPLSYSDSTSLHVPVTSSIIATMWLNASVSSHCKIRHYLARAPSRVVGGDEGTMDVAAIDNISCNTAPSQSILSRSG